MSKKTIGIIVAVLVVICVVVGVVLLTGGKDNDKANETPAKKLTKAEITAALEEVGADGTLTIEGSEDNVTGFTYVVTNVNASSITSDYLTKAINKLSTNPGSITYGELKSCYTFLSIAGICSLFEDDDSNFDSSQFINEIVSVICNGKSKTYDNWTITAQLDKTNDKITISVTSK